jgi:hypothetical protein
MSSLPPPKTGLKEDHGDDWHFGQRRGERGGMLIFLTFSVENRCRGDQLPQIAPGRPDFHQNHSDNFHR